MKPPRIHAIPLGIPSRRETVGITELAQRERNTPVYQPRHTYTGTQLLERLRATPDHLRPGQVER